MLTQMNEGFQLIHDIFRLRWIPEIINTIDEEHHKYSSIAENIPYISNTELNRKLAILQEREVVIKTEDGYFLTEFGEDLSHVFAHFQTMSEKYILKTSNETLL